MQKNPQAGIAFPEALDNYLAIPRSPARRDIAAAFLPTAKQLASKRLHDEQAIILNGRTLSTQPISESDGASPSQVPDSRIQYIYMHGLIQC